MTYHSGMRGALRALVAEHVVQGRIIFPAAGYLEMAHAAANMSTSGIASSAKLCGVFFLLPLTLTEVSADAVVAIECTPFDSFTVSTLNSSGDSEVHCSGSVANHTAENTEPPLSFSRVRDKCSESLDVLKFYHALDQSGLNYGPAFRAVEQAWISPNNLPRVALLRPRKSRYGTNVHPADLDAALQLSVANLLPGNTSTRLPFSVDDAQLEGCGGTLWASVEAQGSEANFIALGSCTQALATRLDGFKARELRAVAKQQPWYSTEWISNIFTPVASSNGKAQQVLMVSDVGAVSGCKQLAPFSSKDSTADAMAKAMATIFASPLQQGTLERDGLFLAAAALALVQSAAAASPVWLLTAGAQNAIFSDIANPTHAGQIGLARTARAEAMLPIFCVDVTLGLSNDSLAKIATSGSIANASEPEAVLRGDAQHVPRLTYAPQMLPGQVSLGFLPRGALSNLRIEPQLLSSQSSDIEEAELCVRAVGLNFRDVLNVLGEYPGDPGPSRYRLRRIGQCRGQAI